MFALTGCITRAPVSEENNADSNSAQLANPASVNCLAKGGILEMRQDELGVHGVCKFEDGIECEEWAFYRGECPSADSTSSPQAGSGQAEQDEDIPLRQGSDGQAENTDDGLQGDKENVGNEVTTGNEKIKVFGIEAGDNLVSPVTIKGEGVAFESTLQVELRNKDHEIMVHEFVTIKSSEVGEIGPFAITLNFEFDNTKEGYVAVYEQSAKDGSELNLVEIPVTFNKETTEDETTEDSE